MVQMWKICNPSIPACGGTHSVEDLTSVKESLSLRQSRGGTLLVASVVVVSYNKAPVHLSVLPTYESLRVTFYQSLDAQLLPIGHMLRCYCSCKKVLQRLSANCNRLRI